MTILFRIVSLIFILFAPFRLEAGSKGYWKSGPPTPTATTEASVAIVKDKIYIFGGFTPNGISAKVDILDLTTGKWSEGNPLPRGLHHTSASVVDEKIFVIGGFEGGLWSPVAFNFEYNPAADTWREKQPMPTARGAMAAGVIDGKIYVVGGALKKFFRLVNTDAHEVYDPQSDIWQALPAIPTPRDHLAVSVSNGILYSIGGRINVDYNQNLDQNEAYNPITNHWAAKTPLPTARSGITAQTLSGKIFVFGGENRTRTFQENEAYDPTTDSWKTMKPLREGRHGLGSSVYRDTLHILTGGPNPGAGGSKFHEIFSMRPFGESVLSPNAR